MTPYPNVNETLTALHESMSHILGPRLVGLYLYGSLATGDFDSETSDIDFCCVTTDPVADLADQLRKAHEALWNTDRSWSLKLEGAYVDREQIRRQMGNGVPVPCVNERRFYLAPLGSDWDIQRHIIREHGIVVDGPNPTTLIDPVTPEQLRDSVRSYLDDWWRPMLKDPGRLEDSEYRVYAVLSMCRARYTLKFGQIASKRQSAEWLMEETPSNRAVIKDALGKGGREAPSEDLTRQFIRTTLEYAEKT